MAKKNIFKTDNKDILNEEDDDIQLDQIESDIFGFPFLIAAEMSFLLKGVTTVWIASLSRGGVSIRLISLNP